MKLLNTKDQTGFYRPAVKDKDQRIRKRVEKICSTFHFVNKGGLETMIFEAGIPIIESNLKAVNDQLKQTQK